MAEWLRRGLQILARRFDSGSGLHSHSKSGRRRAGGSVGPPAEVKIADAGAAALPAEPPRPETIARKMRRWHDGTDMGPVWQAVIFLGGIIPALLSITGIVIWARARRRALRANGAPRPAAA